MVFVRVAICQDVCAHLKKAATIAIRYSAVRRQVHQYNKRLVGTIRSGACIIQLITAVISFMIRAPGLSLKIFLTYTKQFNYLQSILKRGCFPYKVLENTKLENLG
jgi:hypothetical protein